MNNTIGRFTGNFSPNYTMYLYTSSATLHLTSDRYDSKRGFKILFHEGTKCFDLKITNNIAAGCKFGGFIAPGHDCGDSQSTKFRNNVAHSSNGAGAYIYPDVAGKRHDRCYEGSHFTGYKNTL